MDISKYIDEGKRKRNKRSFSGNTRDNRTTPEIISSKDNTIDYLCEFIQDKELSIHIRNVLKQCVPDYFWTKPSSSTGKYHPFDERGKFGLVLHTCRVTKLTNELCTAAQIEGKHKDNLICAAIMHDTLKYGDPEENLQHTTKDHSNLVQKYINEDSIYSPISDDIIRLIRTHDGQWSVNPDEWRSADDHQKLLHYADYISSRRYIYIRIP